MVSFWWAEEYTRLWRERRRTVKLTAGKSLVLWMLLARTTDNAVVLQDTATTKKDTLRVSFLVVGRGGDWLRQSIVAPIRFVSYPSIPYGRSSREPPIKRSFINHLKHTQKSTSAEVLFCGGQRWIRTYKTIFDLLYL